MTAMFDASELKKLSADLRAAGPKISPKISGLLTSTANTVARDARAAAPKDRPWLSTAEGIRVETRGKFTRTIISGLDPKGESVGYRVEYGTSVQAARPFLGPAMKRHRETFNRAALDIASKVL